MQGKTIGIDATTLEAKAGATHSGAPGHGAGLRDVREGTGKSSGVPTSTREELVRFDRKRKKKTSNREWMNPHDPDAKITKLKDGRTRLGHKVEEAVDLETGAVVAVTAPEELGRSSDPRGNRPDGAGGSGGVGSGAQVREVVADKGYHSNETVLELMALGLRRNLSETDWGRRNWKGKNRKY